MTPFLGLHQRDPISCSRDPNTSIVHCCSIRGIQEAESARMAFMTNMWYTQWNLIWPQNEIGGCIENWWNLKIYIKWGNLGPGRLLLHVLAHMCIWFWIFRWKSIWNGGVLFGVSVVVRKLERMYDKVEIKRRRVSRTHNSATACGDKYSHTWVHGDISVQTTTALFSTLVREASLCLCVDRSHSGTHNWTGYW